MQDPLDSPPINADAGGPAAVSERLESTADGRLRCQGLDERFRFVALGMHLWWLSLLLPVAIVAPAIPVGLWLWKRKESAWIDDHGREVINFALSQLVLALALTISIVGIVALPVVWVIGVIGMVRGAIAAGRGEYFRYPMTFRFL